MLWMYFYVFMLFVVYWHVPYSDAIDAEITSVEVTRMYVCMYVFIVCMYVFIVCMCVCMYCMYVCMYVWIPVMGLCNNCSSLTVMNTLPYVDYFFHLSVQIRKCERVKGMQVIQRVQIVMNFCAMMWIRWGMLQRTNAKTNSFCKKSGCYNERGEILSANVARASTWRVGPIRFDESVSHLFLSFLRFIYEFRSGFCNLYIV